MSVDLFGVSVPAGDLSRFNCLYRGPVVDPVERLAILRTITARVILGERSLRIELDRSELRTILNLPSVPFDVPHFSVTVPAVIKAVGNEVKLAIDAPPGEQAPEHDNTLLRVVVQGNDWWRRLLWGEVKSVVENAQAEGLTPSYVSRLIDLAFLAPDITTAILDGRQPAELTSKRLARARVPEAWDEQRTLLGCSVTGAYNPCHAGRAN